MRRLNFERFGGHCVFSLFLIFFPVSALILWMADVAFVVVYEFFFFFGFSDDFGSCDAIELYVSPELGFDL